MKRARRDHLISAPDDGLDADAVGEWAERKYRVIRAYAEMFSTGMKRRWPTRVYVDLFASSGHAVFRESGRRVLASPLIALSVPDPFTKHVFCDRNREKLDVLKRRVQSMWPGASVSYIEGDANERASAIAEQISREALSLCFLDPYDLKVDFALVRALGDKRALDFVMVLMLPMDANRNWSTYLKDESDRIDRWLGSRMWRERWPEAQQDRVRIAQFLATEYAGAMATLGYLTTSTEQMIPVRTARNNLLLYYLAFFSKNKLGYRFWHDVQKYPTDQLPLDLQ